MKKGIKYNLLSRGYFPENLPPSFKTIEIAEKLTDIKGYLSKKGTTLNGAPYNSSKRGLTRRVFSAIHPETAHDLSLFIEKHWKEINNFIKKSEISFSKPEPKENSKRAFTIPNHSEIEIEKYKLLSKYKYIATTDISRFYHSIYTHSLPWAFHGKEASKNNRKISSSEIFFNRADFIIRNGQDGQTIGIPVGPDMSRILAEVISVAIDLKFKEIISEDNIKYTAIRHVDDIWIGTHTFTDAERVLTRYREAIRYFELDINEIKTNIHSTDFSFSDLWPLKISRDIDYTIKIGGKYLISSLENAFSIARKNNDDGIIKYILRKIDKMEACKSKWDTIEPFLKRATVHFGHAIDYIVRILIWRYLKYKDLDKEEWENIFNEIIYNHARLGNDSEVVWSIYLISQLNLNIDEKCSKEIIRNCGPLSIVALLNTIEYKECLFDMLKNRVKGDYANSSNWPIILEWKSKEWKGYKNLEIKNETIKSLSEKNITIYDPKELIPVFQNVENTNFDKINEAIETESNLYIDIDHSEILEILNNINNFDE